MDTEFDFLHSVILTAGVFAAIITSTANIVISMINNRRLKTIEKNKQVNEIVKYRYSRLYELILNWHKYDSEWDGETVGEIANQRLLNTFLDNTGRYEIARPLLDSKYIAELDAKQAEGKEILYQLVLNDKDGKHTENFDKIWYQYVDIGSEFSELLKNTINEQLSVLLNNNNKSN